jgi:hypothetical protein
MPVIEIERRGRFGRREITFKNVAPAPRAKAPSPVRAPVAVKSAPVKKAVKAQKQAKPMIPLAVSSKALDDLLCATSGVWRDNLPLQIGVDDQIRKIARAAGHSKNAVRRAIELHCLLPDYLRNLAADGARRLSLEGEDCGPVTAEQKSIALKMLSDGSTPFQITA